MRLMAACNVEESLDHAATLTVEPTICHVAAIVVVRGAEEQAASPTRKTRTGFNP
jgi:hypothetical protein